MPVPIFTHASKHPFLLCLGALLLLYLISHHILVTNHQCANQGQGQYPAGDGCRQTTHTNSTKRDVQNATKAPATQRHKHNKVSNTTKSANVRQKEQQQKDQQKEQQQKEQQKQTEQQQREQQQQKEQLGKSQSSVDLNRTNQAESCSNCFKRPYSFTINSPEVCAGTTPSLKLLILITTIHAHQKRRESIRSTWGSLTRGNTHPQVRYAFLLGHKSPGSDAAIVQERQQFQDLILQNFTDSYRNLTLKTLMALEWAEAFCPSAQFIMKTDDDVYTHVENILRLLESRQFANVIFGACIQKVYPKRDPRSKYYVSIIDYPHKIFHGVCSGTGYIMPRQVAHEVLRTSPNIPFFFMEDVYVGRCARKLGYKLVKVDGFMGWPKLGQNGTCGGFGSRTLYTVHEVKSSRVMKIWSQCPQVVA